MKKILSLMLLTVFCSYMPLKSAQVQLPVNQALQQARISAMDYIDENDDVLSEHERDTLMDAAIEAASSDAFELIIGKVQQLRYAAEEALPQNTRARILNAENDEEIGQALGYDSDED